jgi:hypothetical protein
MSSRVTGILRKSVSGDTPDKRGRSATFGEDAFANLAIGLIGRFVREVRVDAPKSFRIVFTDESEIRSRCVLSTMKVQRPLTSKVATTSGRSSRLLGEKCPYGFQVFDCERIRT